MHSPNTECLMDYHCAVTGILLFSFTIFFSVAGYNITTTRFIGDGETIVSDNGYFEMGFFSPASSVNRYLGIWYKNLPIRTVVWVANTEMPIAGKKSGVSKVILPGIIAVVDSSSDDKVMWSSNISSATSSRNPIAELLDSGNLVVRDAGETNPENFFWQSFDYPGDTLLPGMKLGKNFVTGREVHLTSWRSNDDPYPGDFTFHCDPTGYPQNVLEKGPVEVFRSGPWNGIGFSGIPSLKKNPVFKFKVIIRREEVYSRFELLNSSGYSKLTLTPAGDIRRQNWVESEKDWKIFLTSPADSCDNYKLCGGNGICNPGNSPICRCPDKFEPRKSKDWEKSDWSNGCVRKTALDCRNNAGDVFTRYSGVKMPDTRNSWHNKGMSLKECEGTCLKNCSCMAYSSLDVRKGGSGCLLWFDDLIDMRDVINGVQEIFIRVASPQAELASQGGSDGKKRDGIKMVLALFIGSLLFY